MNGHTEHIKQYTATDIQRYLQGKLSAQEMYAMEKAALDDPFLADAMEGMEQAMQEHGEQVVNGQLQEARQRIANKTNSQSKSAVVVPFRWWRIAAAAAILVIGTVWVYNYFSTGSKEVVAQTNTTSTTDTNQLSPATALTERNKAIAPATTDSADAYRSTLIEDPSKKTFADVDLKKPERQKLSSVAEYKQTEKREAVVADSVVIAYAPVDKRRGEEKPAAIRPAEDVKERDQMEEIVVKNESGKKTSRDSGLVKTRNQLTGKVAGIGFDDNNKSGFISGRVINQNNLPLANASLYVENNRDNFYTDKAGLFKIPGTDSVMDVSVNVAGYGTQRFRLQNNAVAYNYLQLKPDTVALNEVVVSRGYQDISANRKSATDNKALNQSNAVQDKYSSVVVQQAQPVYGWVQYEQYLDESKRTPVNNPGLKGEVVVSFLVSKKGELSGYKIEQSLAKEYDDEAIRLVKEGPRWKSLTSRRSRVTIIVRF
jgi:CarboxypepD_reg-like domain